MCRRGAIHSRWCAGARPRLETVPASFSLNLSDSPSGGTGGGLPPMARDPNPPAGTSDPVAFDPYGRNSRPHNPTPGHPNIICPRPTPIPRSPNIIGSRRNCLGFDPDRRRRLGNNHFASSWPCGGHFPCHGRCRRDRRWLLYAADQCQR
jgi:hypothetical protein